MRTRYWGRVWWRTRSPLPIVWRRSGRHPVPPGQLLPNDQRRNPGSVLLGLRPRRPFQTSSSSSLTWPRIQYFGVLVDQPGIREAELVIVSDNNVVVYLHTHERAGEDKIPLTLLSLSLGFATPDGWLWTRTRAAAECRSASLMTSRG